MDKSCINNELILECEFSKRYFFALFDNSELKFK